jgi:hypothetical protein
VSLKPEKQHAAHQNPTSNTPHTKTRQATRRTPKPDKQHAAHQNVSDKVVEKIKTLLVFNNFFFQKLC